MCIQFVLDMKYLKKLFFTCFLIYGNASLTKWLSSPSVCKKNKYAFDIVICKVQFFFFFPILTGGCTHLVRGFTFPALVIMNKENERACFYNQSNK